MILGYLDGYIPKIVSYSSRTVTDGGPVSPFGGEVKDNTGKPLGLVLT